MDLGLEGARALVTAASRGLGRACAESLAAERAAVFISARDEAALKAAAESIGACGHVSRDLSEPASAEAVVSAAVGRLGGLDILVVNAGGPPRGGFDDLRDEDWEASFELTLMSAVRLVRAALPHLSESGRGRVVVIASLTAREPAADLVLSTAFRSAVTGLAKSLATDLAPAGVTVNCVLPHRILTDRVRELEGARAAAAGIGLKEQMEKTAAALPARRYGHPRELGALCAFLCSRQAAYITGQNVAVDGGFARSVG